MNGKAVFSFPWHLKSEQFYPPLLFWFIIITPVAQGANYIVVKDASTTGNTMGRLNLFHQPPDLLLDVTYNLINIVLERKTNLILYVFV
jgi:hypothetical protein